MVVQRILSGDVIRAVHKKLDGCVRILIGARTEEFPDLCFDGQLFAKLSPEAFLGRFIRFDLAAGKFPLSREAPPLLSPGYQDPPVFLYHSSGDDEWIHRAPSPPGKGEVKAEVKMKNAKTI